MQPSIDTVAEQLEKLLLANALRIVTRKDTVVDNASDIELS